MKKNYWKIVISIIAFLGLFFIFSKFMGSLSFPDASWPLNRGEEELDFKENKQIRQIFETSRNNLSRIRILFSKSHQKDGGEIALKLAKENCEDVISEKKISRESLETEGYYDFKFPRIKDSKNKSFCLLISFEPINKKSKNQLTIFINENNQGQLYAGSEEIKNRSLAMRPAYKNGSFIGNLSELNDRISQYKPWFLKNAYLFSMLTLFVLSSIFFIVLVILI